MIAMPQPDDSVLARRAEIVAALRRLLPGERIVDSAEERRAFECDGLSAYRQMPMVVVLPSTTEQVAKVLRF
jgi:glycolate oxidase